ncbi:hypothetical protein ANO14919_006910 [Xylariales sp. No.14919]|nr:hypothetical protein ANO14919_006910 [Xylariales sp. No.14919]
MKLGIAIVHLNSSQPSTEAPVCTFPDPNTQGKAEMTALASKNSEMDLPSTEY